MIVVFVQAICSLSISALAMSDKELDHGEMEAIIGLSKEDLLLSGALILTSAIQLGLGNLSAYHAVMVLQMTWVLEGPLITSYFLLDVLIERLYQLIRWRGKDERAIDFFETKTPGRLVFALSPFRLVHGICAVIVWGNIALQPTSLKCSNATFLLPNWYVTDRIPNLFFLSLSGIRVGEVLVAVAWAIVHSTMKGGASWWQLLLQKDDIRKMHFVSRMS